MFRRSSVSAAQAQLLEERARAMRFAPTSSEQRLWSRLSGSKLGVGFRRQLVIAPYIVDFACTKARLVVEVDGGYHEERERADARRDRQLTAWGWRVLRFSEQAVMGDLDAVVAEVAAACR
jgi:leucyl-tRNA synthetase